MTNLVYFAQRWLPTIAAIATYRYFVLIVLRVVVVRNLRIKVDSQELFEIQQACYLTVFDFILRDFS